VVMTALLWAGLALAQDTGPRMPDFSPSDPVADAIEAEMLSELIRAYAARADLIFIGEVISASHPNNDAIRGTQAIVTVTERIAGDAPGIIDVLVPPVGDYFDGDPHPVPMNVVPGYTMVFFADDEGTVIAHNALFLVEGGYAWRTKSEGVFLDPIRDRLWTESIDPSRDYVLVPLAELREKAQPRRAAQQVVQRRTRRDR